MKENAKLAKKIDSFEKIKYVNPNKVPAKILVPLLEGCALEEDVALQDMWEALLINAASPENKKTFISGYIDILKQMTSEEVQLLNRLYTEYKDDKFSVSALVSQDIENQYDNNSDEYKKMINSIKLYIANLVRMNLIKK